MRIEANWPQIGRLGFFVLVIALTNVALMSVATLVAQEAANAPEPQLPANPAMWINSPPLSKEMLSGKAAVFYFFDEECPRCVEAWPKTLFAANKFDGEPILFIGVNSGTPRPQVEAYSKKNRVPWPIICDPDRSFERQFGFTISLQNIAQVRLLMPNGKFRPGDWNNIEGSAVDALREAKWKIDPKGIPQVLHPAWQAIEFGRYPDAAALVKKSLNQKGEIKEAAQRLNQYVLDDLNGQLDAAKKDLDDGNKWEAYKRYSTIPAHFKGYALPADVAATVKELAADDAITEEQATLKKLDHIRQLAAKSPTSAKAAIKQLQALVRDHANTEAAREAQKLLDQAGTQ